MLELAAESGCTLLSIGFESITRSTLTSVHKHVNRPETFVSLVEKVHSYGIMVFGLFMFGFDGDDGSVFEETARFNISANYDACAYSVLTPYPGTLTWYEMKKANRIVSLIGQSTTRQTWSIDRRRCRATNSGWVRASPTRRSTRRRRSPVASRSAEGEAGSSGPSIIYS